MSVRRTAVIRPLVGTVRVRKTYFDCRFGQLHVRTAFPTSGGFDERTTLICFHPTGATSRVFDALLPLLATDRSVYAPDAPGSGESDPPMGAASDRIEAADWVAGVCDFLEAMRFRTVDLLACGDAVVGAAELARRLPTVVRRRLDLTLQEWEALRGEPRSCARRVREALG